MAAVRVRPPSVPLTVNAYVPLGVELFVRTDSVDDPAAGLGLNVPVAPPGSPVTLRLT